MNWLYDAFAHVSAWMVWLGATIADVTADIFWDTATSIPVLSALALIALAAWLVTHLPVIAQLIPGVAAWQRLAVIVQTLSIVALIFLIGFRVADNRAEAESLKNDLAWAQFQLDQQRQVADAADQLKNEADARAAEAEGKLNEYTAKFGKSACPPPPGYLEWLRTLQQRKPRSAGADQPPHPALARLREIGGQRQ